jgi:glucose-1-phosphate cytidylyltransferase
LKVLILCGGLGTRAYPFTRLMPKALMPVGGRPVVEQVMRVYASHGFDEFVLAVGYMKQDISRYFGHSRDWNVRCVDTGLGTDTGERVLRCLPYLGSRFHVTYCDGLGDIDIARLATFHASHGDGATLTAVPLRSQYGVLRFDDGDRVAQFVEKPVLREHWINAGFFVFDADAFASLIGTNLERDLLPAMAVRGQLHAFRHDGFWRSMDTHKDQIELDGLWSAFDDLGEQAKVAVTRVPHWLRVRYAAALGEMS